jgi:hypothetical protein
MGVDGTSEHFKTHVLVPVVVALSVCLLALAVVLSAPSETAQVVARATPTVAPAKTPAPKPLSKQQFVAKADKLCGKLDKVTLDPKSSGLEDSAKDIAKFRKQFVAGLDAILRLEPPAKDRKFIEKYFFTPVRDDKKIITVYLKRMEKAFLAGDLVELSQLRSVGYGNVGAFNDNVPKLQKYGFRVCVPPPPEQYVAPSYVPPPQQSYIPPAPYSDPYYPTPAPYVPPQDPYYPPTYPTPTPTPFIDIGI